MLPFLKNKQVAGPAVAVVKERAPDDPNKPQENQALEAIASDLIKAIQSGNAKAVAEALQAAHDMCDQEPHVEGEHI